MPQDDEKAPERGADDARVDRVMSGMKGTNMPDILKVKASSSGGEKFAAYQASHPLKGGDDTQKLEPAVVIDQTQQDGISASEVQKLAKERRERISREATTSVIELDKIPKKKNTAPLVVFLVMLGIAFVALIVKSQEEPDAEAIAPASAAAVSQEPSIPPVPTQMTTATEPTTNAMPPPTSASPTPSQNASAHVGTNHGPATASSAADDPDKALFKTHRTP